MTNHYKVHVNVGYINYTLIILQIIIFHLFLYILSINGLKVNFWVWCFSIGYTIITNILSSIYITDLSEKNIKGEESHV